MPTSRTGSSVPARAATIAAASAAGSAPSRLPSTISHVTPSGSDAARARTDSGKRRFFARVARVFRRRITPRPPATRATQRSKREGSPRSLETRDDAPRLVRGGVEDAAAPEGETRGRGGRREALRRQELDGREREEVVRDVGEARRRLAALLGAHRLARTRRARRTANRGRRCGRLARRRARPRTGRAGGPRRGGARRRRRRGRRAARARERVERGRDAAEHAGEAARERSGRREAVHVVDAQVRGDAAVPALGEARREPAVSRAEVEDVERPPAFPLEGRHDAPEERVERARAHAPLGGERARP